MQDSILASQEPWVLYVSAIAAGLVALYFYKASHLSRIPTVGGPSGPITSYIGALKWKNHAREIIQEAYYKHKEGICKVALPDKWIVVLCGIKMVEELRKAPNEILSPDEQINETLQIKLLVGGDLVEDHLHINMIRRHLTNVTGLLEHIHEEMLLALDATITLPEYKAGVEQEWVTLPALQLATRIFVRVANRIFVGEELCRNKDFLGINFEFALKLIGYARFLNRFPVFLQPLANRLFVDMKSTLDRGVALLTPIIEERIKGAAEGDESQPDDMITWMMQGPVKRAPRDIVLRILVLNFASLFTTSMACAFAMIQLADHPELQDTLREEVKACIEREGSMTKTALNKMYKLDSFIKEAQRCTVGALAMGRKTMQPYTFSDGTYVPSGVTVYCSALAMHEDPDRYANPLSFDPFRFERMRTKTTGENSLNSLLSTSADFLMYGHGKNACPGRFFASIELITLFAELVLKYDIKAPPEGNPPMVWIGPTPQPNQKAQIMFRRRM